VLSGPWQKRGCRLSFLMSIFTSFTINITTTTSTSLHVVTTEYGVCGGQHLPHLFSAFVSHNLLVIASGQVRSVSLHVPANLKSSFLPQHHSRQLRFLQPHVLQSKSLSSAQHLVMPATTLYPSMATAIHPLFTSTSSSLRPSPRSVTRSSLGTLQRIAVLVILAPLESCPVLLPFSSYSSVSRYRHRQVAICSPPDRAPLVDARIRSLINTP
jgi:hypothetical protein